MRIAVFLACIALAFARRPVLRVSGGQVAPAGSRPYQASILYSDYGADQFCGGALIHPRWVLTSGTCVNFEEVYVGLGFHDLRDGAAEGAVIIKGSWIQHPQYDYGTIANDIALIELDSPVSTSDTIEPISLPQPSSDPSSGSSMLVSGWGLTSNGGSLPWKMSQAIVTVTSRDTCVSSGYNIDDSMICSDSTSQDICQGDDGGPAVTNYNENSHSSGVILQAIISRGHGCLDNNVPSLYTRVGAFCDWIDSTTSGDAHC